MKKRSASPQAVSKFAEAALSRSGASLAVAAQRVRRGPADPAEAVHELRVAIRRVRSDLRIFGDAFDREWLETTQRQLRDLARVVGEARDVDVTISRLEQIAETLPQADQSGVASLLTRLRLDRGAAVRRALDALGDHDRAAALEGLAIVAARGRQLPAIGTMDDLVVATRRQWRRLRKSVAAADDAPSEENLHLVRVRAKTLRYSLETLAPVLDSSARDHAKALVALQDRLGSMQDADVIERWLRVAHETGGDGFTIGMLVGFERARKESVRATWRDEWERASRNRLLLWTR